MEKHVLLIEPDNDARVVFREMLKRQGFEVVSAASAFEGLEIIEKRLEEFQLLMVSREMPEKLGLELVGVVRGKRKSVRIILTTTNSDLKIREVSREAGADYVLEKPFSIQKLHDALFVLGVV